MTDQYTGRTTSLNEPIELLCNKLATLWRKHKDEAERLLLESRHKAYQNEIKKFLKLAYKEIIQHGLIAFATANDIVRFTYDISGTFTVFSHLGETNEPIVAPLNWKTIRDSERLNPGFTSCYGKESNALVTCLNKLGYSSSRMMKDKVKWKGAVWWRLKEAKRISKSSISELFHTLNELKDDDKLREKLILNCENSKYNFLKWSELWIYLKPKIEYSNAGKTKTEEAKLILKEIYYAFSDLYLFRTPSKYGNNAFLSDSEHYQQNLKKLSSHKPSAASFLELALSLLIIPDATLTLYLHLGAPSKSTELSSGALVLICTEELPENLFFGIRILAEQVLAHVLLLESRFITQQKERFQEEKRALQLAFRNTGHMLRNRLDGVSEYFRLRDHIWFNSRLKNEDGDCTKEIFAYQSVCRSAHGLSKTLLTLELWGFRTLSDFLV